MHLNLNQGDTCVDCTLGGAGHALSIVKAIMPGGRFIGMDQDMDALIHAKEFLSGTGVQDSGSIELIHSSFSRLPDVLHGLGIDDGVDGILMDLGLSFHQLSESKRGFTFQEDEPLDMRMDTETQTTAADIVNHFGKKQLTDIFFKYGEERMSRKIAGKIVEVREKTPFKTTRQLSDLIVSVMPAKLIHSQKIHPSTRVFQALRIAVNRELEELETIMKSIPDILKPGGRLCVISFHSLEDRIVKQKIKSFEKGCTCPREFPRCVCGFTPKLKSVFRKPLMPGKDEIQKNPMSRSAKLRVAVRL